MNTLKKFLVIAFCTCIALIENSPASAVTTQLSCAQQRLVDRNRCDVTYEDMIMHAFEAYLDCVESCRPFALLCALQCSNDYDSIEEIALQVRNACYKIAENNFQRCKGRREIANPSNVVN